eukprot:c9418_g1_i1.p1 GENE.c9418_g1_i1~~c9418_g1_i1.p1  ORF type:complete len:590 (-),score=146.58 c9418_g1_i1:59-1618(-)
MSVWTGPTGSGKTTFLSMMSLDLCRLKGVRTLWGSFEITNAHLMKKMVTQFAGCDLDGQTEKFRQVAKEMSKIPMYYMSFHGHTKVEHVIDTMEYAVYSTEVDHIILDNLQFMTSDLQSLDKWAEMERALTKFRNFASNWKVHLTVVIHPRKTPEDQPLNTDSVFGIAKATQEADNIIILQSSSARGKQLEVKKNRWDGTVGSVELIFDEASLRYKEGEANSRRSRVRVAAAATTPSAQLSVGAVTSASPQPVEATATVPETVSTSPVSNSAPEVRMPVAKVTTSTPVGLVSTSTDVNGAPEVSGPVTAVMHAQLDNSQNTVQVKQPDSGDLPGQNWASSRTKTAKTIQPKTQSVQPKSIPSATTVTTSAAKPQFVATKSIQTPKSVDSSANSTATVKAESPKVSLTNATVSTAPRKSNSISDDELSACELYGPIDETDDHYYPKEDSVLLHLTKKSEDSQSQAANLEGSKAGGSRKASPKSKSKESNLSAPDIFSCGLADLPQRSFPEPWTGNKQIVH